MSKSLVIVESPAKARTIGKYLGEDYFVRACAGHIKDLPQKALGVNIRRDFEPTYKVISGKEKIVADLKKEAKRAEAIYLAADPDREGEAICFHLASELNGTKGRQVYRILFNEITKPAIREALEHPAGIDQNKVEAQQARRILDRLVGYKVSPLLWRKVRKGLSAGRVQTVALRFIVEREREIRAFEPEEYWNFTARLQSKNPPPFEAKAVKYDGAKFKISNQSEADRLLAELRAAQFQVTSLTKKERRRNPTPPFITSKLQQDAVRQLGFTVRKTMTVAQRLYEGVEIGDEGSVGLITYMRTDSTRIAESALQEVRGYIGEKFGRDYLPGKPRKFRSKKATQDAHEAIRPTSIIRTPQSLKRILSKDEFRLYELIWNRFVASQMNPAIFDQTSIVIQAGKTEFKAVGSIMKFDGYLKVYRREQDAEQGEGNLLPPVGEGERLQVDEILPEQKFTQPPPRYNEASLVKALEEKEIGRPSTYQQILSVIVNKEYVVREEKRFQPTELGEVVNDLLLDHFAELFDYDYTAKLEVYLDEIEEGKRDWVQALSGFYEAFKVQLEAAREGMKDLRREQIPTDENCEKCGSQLVIKWGRFGRFLACSNYPQCKNTRELNGSADPTGTPEMEESCEKCGRPMVFKKGRYGKFLACSGYPQCRNTRRIVEENGQIKISRAEELKEPCPKCGKNLERKHGRYGEFIACSDYPECRYIRPISTGVQCPSCKQGEVVERRSKRGRVFYGCERYPDCGFVSWSRPVPEACPKCGADYLLERTTKRDGTFHSCADKECDYRTSVTAAAS